MKSGLYTAPGDSATARAAATARRLAEPRMKLSNRWRGSTCITSLSHRRAQSLEHELGDAAKRLEDARAVQRIGAELRNAAEIQRVVQFGRGENEIAWQILLVVLNDERHGPRVDPLLREIRVQVLEALDVLVELSRLRIGDEHDTVRALEHELPRRLVIHLAGHRVELEFRREARDRAEIEREKIEEQCAIGLGRERNHLALSVLRHLPVDVVQVRRLPGPTWPVVDDLARDLARGVVDERHGERG